MKLAIDGGLSNVDAILAIENYDSDMDSAAYSNRFEMRAGIDSQPGWNADGTNLAYFKDGSQQAATPPAGIGNLDPGPACTDADSDGYSVEGGDCGPVDCDDTDPGVNPGAAEVCTDGIDNDCDGLIDATDPDAVNCPVECTDLDTDTYAIDGGSCGPVDCDDNNSSVNPGATEDCNNGIDDDCDGLIDAADTDCGACIPTASNEKGPRCRDGLDNDCNGLIDSEEPSCGGGGGGGGDKEVCDDNIDNDGDGKTDCADRKDCNKDPAC
jgi:hypothetical protein